MLFWEPSKIQDFKALKVKYMIHGPTCEYVI